MRSHSSFSPMDRTEIEKKLLGELEARIQYLEDVNRFTLDALDMAASLGDFQASINKMQQPSDILGDARSRTKQLIPFQSVAFLLVDEGSSDFYVADTEGEEMAPYVQAEVDFLIENGTFGWALREHRPIIVSSRDFKDRVVLHTMTTTSRIRGMFFGILDSGNPDLPDVSLSLLSIILLNTANALESFELYKMIRDINLDLEKKIQERTKQLEYHALHDPLTDLPNRVLIFDRIDYEMRVARRKAKSMALLLIDLDRFKDVNDTLGHQAGDRILMDFGQRLRQIMRETDTIARLGGDEFAVFLSEITEPLNAVDIAQRVIKSMDEPFIIDGQHISLDASIGIALIPTHGHDKDTILRKADMAMYAAKRAQSGFAIFDPDHDQNNLARLTLMAELRRAVDDQELLLFYQPKVEMAAQRICGVEALLRWNNPKRGFVPPNQFIPLAEQGGLIRPLTLKVIRMALEQQKAWLASGLDMPVAVNLSALNLQDVDLPDQVAELLEEFDVPSDCLELEITESAIMTTPSRGLKVMDHLSRMGIKLSIDDFGTGYSSLAYLKKLPVQVIKIDLSFIINMHKDPTDAKIVNSIIDLAHNLGLQIIAEGVESQEIWTKLAALNCNMAQGYYISRPLPVEQLTKWIQESSWGL